MAVRGSSTSFGALASKARFERAFLGRLWSDCSQLHICLRKSKLTLHEASQNRNLDLEDIVEA